MLGLKQEVVQKLSTLEMKCKTEESSQRQRWISNFYQEKYLNEGKTVWAHISLFQRSQASALGANNSNTISSPFSLLYITNAKRKRKKNENEVFLSLLFIKTSNKIQFEKKTIAKKFWFTVKYVYNVN